MKNTTFFTRHPKIPSDAAVIGGVVPGETPEADARAAVEAAMRFGALGKPEAELVIDETCQTLSTANWEGAKRVNIKFSGVRRD